MRHRVASKRLKRTGGELKLLLRNMAKQLFERGFVKTTLPKAKILRPFAEKLITQAKKKDFNQIKRVGAVLNSESVSRTLFDKIAPQFAKRSGGYTRILKLGTRSGDAAALARIEFVEKPEEPKKKASKNAKNQV
ncbi:TPA: 50S ribosomal protein L17 [candidate division WWE3 bacterium]|uniref:50S ribosomal protein L17 n=2 Tax=Katanobacteria TaxID=422282 RepID=A0A1F4V4Y3_UNCKA|nr:MAG: 50S ribosomal protein L17 [candidate division WWE3 bacterium RIFCSPHIGHO2_01_FULL_43_9]HAZ29290.1 50S ribosomal protein L17 [candidate division WWE3 bacterium]